MKEEDRNGMTFNEKFWLFWLLALIVLGILTSCKTKYVSVPEYHTTTVTQHDTLIKRDSIYQKDSVYMWKDGDTIWKERYTIVYKDRWRDRILYRDSVRVDSIRVPYPVEVEKKQSFIDRIESHIGKLSLIIIICVIGFYVFKYIRNRKV